MILSDGDILRRDAILWGFTFQEVLPYLKHQQRKILFREAVIRFIVGETEDEREERMREMYRRLAEKAGKSLPERYELRELN